MVGKKIRKRFPQTKELKDRNINVAELCNSKNIVYLIILILKGKKANSNVTQICNEFKPSVRQFTTAILTSRLNKI